MAEFSVNCEKVENVAGQIRKIKGDMASMCDDVRQARQKIGIHSSSMDNVIRSMMQLEENIQLEASNMDKLAAALSSAVEYYCRTEKSILNNQLNENDAGDEGSANNSSSEEADLCSYLQENSKYIYKLFDEYAFPGTFIQDVEWYEVFGYGVANWKEVLQALFSGKGDIVGISEAFMNNPDKCQALLREVIDDICQTEYLDVFSSDQEAGLEIIGNLAEACGYSDITEFIDEMNGMIGDAKTVDKMLKDYSANIAMLNSIKELHPGGSVLGDTIDTLIDEYQNQSQAILMDDIKGKFEEGLVDLADYALGTSFGKVDAVIQTVLGDAPKMNAIDTVITTTFMRQEAVIACFNAAEVIRSGEYSQADINNYKFSFELAKSLTIEAYEGMLSYYSPDSGEASYLEDQLQQLKTMSYDQFNYATNYGEYKSIAGFGGGGGRG